MMRAKRPLDIVTFPTFLQEIFLAQVNAPSYLTAEAKEKSTSKEFFPLTMSLKCDKISAYQSGPAMCITLCVAEQGEKTGSGARGGSSQAFALCRGHVS